MAQKVEVEWTSDLSEQALQPNDPRGFRFGVDGAVYEVDLTAAEAQAFRNFVFQYVKAGRKVGRLPRSGPYLVTNRASRDHEFNARVREWAKAVGYSVADRGRIGEKIIDAFEAANGKIPEAAPTHAPEQVTPQVTATGARTSRTKPTSAKTKTRATSKTTATTKAATSGTGTRRGTTPKPRAPKGTKAESA